MTRRQGKNRKSEPGARGNSASAPQTSPPADSVAAVSHHGRTSLASEIAATTGPKDTEASQQRVVVPLVEETLEVNTYWAESGTVRLTKRVEERIETIPLEVAYEEAEIERVTVNREAAPGEDLRPRQEGDTWIIPVVEEELVITKRLIVREEIYVRKQQLTRQEEISDVVRSEQISLDTTGNLQVTEQ